MRFWFLFVFFGLFLSKTVSAQEACTTGSTCVPAEDMRVFLRLLQDKQCQQSTKPKFQLDPVTIVVDQEGRVYYSGADPHPYALKMSWCNYEVTAEGKVSLVVAEKEPSVWGLRFRPKFAGSFLFVDALESSVAAEGLEFGILWDFIYWKPLNLNLATGFRSIGFGVGLDLTRNFGFYGGYGFSWWIFAHNPQVGFYFAFW